MNNDHRSLCQQMERRQHQNNGNSNSYDNITTTT